MRPEVFTPRHATRWTERLVHRETKVHRPLEIPRSFWGRSRYAKLVRRWLEEFGSGFDFFYVDGLIDELPGVMQASSTLGVPIVLRANGDVKLTDRSAKVTFIAPQTSIAQQLMTSGVSADKIIRIEDGIPASNGPNDRERAEARKALAHINRELRLDKDSRVIVACGRLTRQSGMRELTSAMSLLLNRYPQDRLWILGDGPDRGRLYEEIHQAGMVGDVVLPGSFDHLDEFLQAADVAVVTWEGGCLEHCLPMTIASGVPILAAFSQELRGWFGTDADLVEWFDARDPSSLMKGLIQVLGDQPNALRRAESLRSRMLVRRSRQASVEAHLRLFQRLSRRIQVSRDSSIPSLATLATPG
jgi:glycosyltransferase involved in cell wall biosynthesis